MMAELQYALRCASLSHNHVVMVVPPEQHSAAIRMLVAHSEAGAFGGRSLRLATGGCLSVMSVNEPIFETPFDVMFTGWGQVTVTVEEMNRWRKAANQFLTRVA